MMAGIWMKSLSPSPAGNTGCDVPSIRTATYWTKLSDPPQYQGREVIADPASEEAGLLPKGMISGRLRPYGAAKRRVMPDAEHRSHNGLNNRVGIRICLCENGNGRMQGFRSPGSLQRFVMIFPPSEISLPRPVQTALHFRSIFTACWSWCNGKLSPLTNDPYISSLSALIVGFT